MSLFDSPDSDVRNTTLVAAVLSLLLFGAFFWWFRPGLVLLLAYLLLCLVATLSVPLLYRLAGFRRADEADWLAAREERDYAERRHRLAASREGLAGLGIARGVQQAETLDAILRDFHSLVETRFAGKRKAPIAYLSAATRVHEQAVRNLSDAVAVGYSLSSISRHEPGLRHIPTADHNAREREERLAAMALEQNERLDQLLNQNEELFDALTDTAVEVANIKSVSEYDRLDTLARLVSLAEIAAARGDGH